MNKRMPPSCPLHLCFSPGGGGGAGLDSWESHCGAGWQGNHRVKRAPVTEPGRVGGGSGLPAMWPSTHALSGRRGVGWGAINSRPLTGVGNRNPIQTVW